MGGYIPDVSLRSYGAIFNDEDEKRWKEAVEDAYGDDAESG